MNSKSSHHYTSPEFKEGLGKLIELEAKYAKTLKEVNQLEADIDDLQGQLEGDESLVFIYKEKAYLITFSRGVVGSCDEIEAVNL